MEGQIPERQFKDTLHDNHVYYIEYFEHHSKYKKCSVCNKPTLGIFNAAQEMRKKMAQDKRQ